MRNWTFVLLGLVACSSNFDPGSRVEKLRMLAVRADQPFAKSGETVSLDALAYDPAARPIRYGFALCRNPSSSSLLECFRSVDADAIAISNDPHVSFTVPDAHSLGVVFAACAGELSFTGRVGLPFVCAQNGAPLPLEHFELGEKRVFIHAHDRNENPHIDRVTWDGRDWPEGETVQAAACSHGGNDFKDCPESLAHQIAVASGTIESGVDEAGHAFTERLVVQYYATEGIFEHDVRVAGAPETRWVARKDTPASVRLWMVVRDDRGGVAWTERQIAVTR